MVALFFLGSIAHLVTEWQWFTTLGYRSLFVHPFLIQAGVSVAAFLVGAFFVYRNLGVLLSNIRIPPDTIHIDAGMGRDRTAELLERIHSFSRWGRLAVAGVAGLLWSTLFQGSWMQIVLFFFGEPMGQPEPIYGLDVTFYLFRLPLLQQVLTALMVLSLLVLLAAGALYGMRGLFSLAFLRARSNAPDVTKALRHLSVLLGILLLLLGANALLARYGLLLSAGGVVFGPGYREIHITRHLYALLAGIGGAGFLLGMASLKTRRYRPVALSLAAFLAVSVAGGVVGQIVQSVMVSPNELTVERPYIEHHLAMTRCAYGLDEIREEPWLLEGGALPSEEEPGGFLHPPALDPVVLENMRLLDYRPLRDVYREAQEYRRYYEFHDVDIARYRVDGTYHQVMLSAREMNVDRLPAEAQTPVNRHLKYTHGYGVVMSPVGQFTSGGLPQYFLKDMPLEDTLGLQIERPEIYFGERTNDFALVNTLTREFHYPGQEEIDLVYGGDSGIRMGTLNRLLFAVRERSTFLLFSREFDRDSQILIRRNVLERVHRIAPFLEYDGDPYIAAADGQLYWIIDAYAMSEFFPYSRPFQGNRNYLKNPVKVVVNAYSGTVGFYRIEEDEPITRALDRAFPELFSDTAELSGDLRAQFRYPHPFFSVQAEMLKNYHMTDPLIFYNREDAWDVPTESYQDRSIVMEPYYATLRLPDSTDAEFVLMLPFTPVQRNNMIAWLGARSDGDRYGELVLYRFPASRHIYGPQQVDARIDQQPEISQQLSLWDGQGSRVIRGNLLVIPLREGVLYVEPLYLQADEGSYPEMRRVIAVWGDRVVMEETLEEALAALGARRDVPGEPDEEIVGEDPDPDAPDPPAEELDTIRDLVDAAIRIDEEAKRVLREDGDWARYGELQEELSEILGRLGERVSDALDPVP